MTFQGFTRFANMPPFSAGLLIILLIAAMVYGLLVCRPIALETANKKNQGVDLVTQRYIVEHIQAGEGYYKAAGDKLRSMGYTTQSVFNWRLPVLAWLLGHLPGRNTGQTLIVLLAVVNLLVWMAFFYQNHYSFWQTLFGSLILSGPITCGLLPDLYLAHELWAGTLIALSLAAYAGGCRFLSVTAGLMALFLRELSLPFVCIMLGFAIMEGRRRDALAWLMGIAVFGGELLWHWSIVSSLITENDRALHGGWIVFGGWPFVLNTAQMFPYLFLAPQWVIALILPLALLGLAGWRGKSGSRVAATVGTYILAFTLVGRSFNQYWGMMYCFIMPLGLFHAPYALRDLWKPICGKLKKVDTNF